MIHSMDKSGKFISVLKCTFSEKTLHKEMSNFNRSQWACMVLWWWKLHPGGEKNCKSGTTADELMIGAP